MAQVLQPLNIDSHPNVLVGTSTSDDAGVYKLSDDLALVQTVDFFPPLVDDPVMFGRIAAANSLSDVYAMGGEPLTAMNIVAFPDNELPLEILSKILMGGAEKVAESGAALVGGHTVRDTEIKYGLSVTGRIHPDRICTNANARVGEVLVLTKPLGTGVMAAATKKQICPPALYEQATAAMARLNKGASDAMIEHELRAATDITGFGLIGHAYEMAAGAGVEIVFDASAIPYLDGVRELVAGGLTSRVAKETGDALAGKFAFADTVDEIDRMMMLDAQTSGGLLIAVPADRAESLLKSLHDRDAPESVVVGEVRPAGDAGPRVVVR